LIAPVEDDSQIKFVLLQGRKVSGGIVAGNGHFDSRVSDGKGGKCRRQNGLAILFRNSDPHWSIKWLGANGRGRFVQKLDDPLGIGKQLIARSGQDRSSRISVKQRFADRFLQALDLSADGRLRAADALRGHGKIRCLADDEEGSEQIAFDRVVHRRSQIFLIATISTIRLPDVKYRRTQEAFLRFPF